MGLKFYFRRFAFNSNEYIQQQFNFSVLTSLSAATGAWLQFKPGWLWWITDFVDDIMMLCLI